MSMIVLTYYSISDDPYVRSLSFIGKYFSINSLLAESILVLTLFLRE